MVFVWSLPAAVKQTPISDSKTQEKEGSYHNGQTVLVRFIIREIARFIHENRDDIAAVSTIVIAIFTVILGVATWRLWLTTDNLVTGADETAQKQLRAYLLPKGGTISVNGMDHSVITFINNGQTPAYNVGTYSAHAVVDFPLPDNAVFSMADIERGSFGDIGAAGERNIELFFALSPEDMDAINNRRKAIFFWGMIEYGDIFNRETHTTEFRLYYGGDACFPNGRMAIAKGGNKST